MYISGYVNVYHDPYGNEREESYQGVYSSKQEADLNAGPYRIACVFIETMGEEC